MEEIEKEQDSDAGVLTKETILRQYSFYHLRIHLKCGRNLIAKDKNGKIRTFFNTIFLYLSAFFMPKLESIMVDVK